MNERCIHCLGIDYIIYQDQPQSTCNRCASKTVECTK